MTEHGTQTLRDLLDLLKRGPRRPSKHWAHELLARDDISPVQRELAKQALRPRAGITESEEDG